MTEIVVPIIAPWMKFIVTPTLAFISVFAIVWGARKFFWCAQIVRGVCPPPPKATRSTAVVGLAIHLVIVTIGVAAGYFLLGLLTTDPFIISDDGLTIGAHPPHYQARFVPWSEMTRVVCAEEWHRYPRTIYLYVYTRQGRATLSNAAVPLDGVQDFFALHLPKEVVRPCR